MCAVACTTITVNYFREDQYMKIYLNGQAYDTQSQSLAELLRECQFDVDCVASAVDGAFVPRQRYSETALAAGQKIEVLAPMQGG